MDKHFTRYSDLHKEASQNIEKAQSKLKLKSELTVEELALENERLKTSVMILNQRLNDRADTETEVGILKKKNINLNKECDQLRLEIVNLKSDLSQKDYAITNYDKTVSNLNDGMKLLEQE
jgi:uncharacterized protein (DUF3084 family)